MEPFKALRDIPPQQIWDGVVARTVDGARMSFAIVELSPNSRVDQHHHANEQMGIVLRGALTFTIGDQTRTCGTGDTYVIPPDVPHHAVAGSDGAVVVDVFAPVREDWRQFEPQAPCPPEWP